MIEGEKARKNPRKKKFKLKLQKNLFFTSPKISPQNPQQIPRKKEIDKLNLISRFPSMNKAKLKFKKNHLISNQRKKKITSISPNFEGKFQPFKYRVSQLIEKGKTTKIIHQHNI